MPVSKDNEHREIAAHYAEKWGVPPGDILWEGALYFKQYATSPPEFAWEYKEFIFGVEGRRANGDEVLWLQRSRPIPEEWIEEYEQAVRDLYQN